MVSHDCTCGSAAVQRPPKFIKSSAALLLSGEIHKIFETVTCETVCLKGKENVTIHVQCYNCN